MQHQRRSWESCCDSHRVTLSSDTTTGSSDKTELRSIVVCAGYWSVVETTLLRFRGLGIGLIAQTRCVGWNRFLSD